MLGILPAGELALYAGYLLAGLAAFLVAYMLFQEEEARLAQESLEENDKEREASNVLVKVTRPFFTQYVVPIVRSKPYFDSRRTEYRRKLISAGLREELTPDEFISFKFFLILFFPLVMGLLQAMEFLDVSMFVILGSGIAGWFYPDFWLKQRIEERHRQIRNAMPFIVDLLALSTEAGLDFVGAIGRVVEKANPSPLVDELDQLLREIKVGSSRAEALREMSIRINMSEMNSFIAILISSDSMGAPIGKTLRQQSETIRNQRFVRAEEAGAAAQPKLIVATVLFVFPAVLILILGPTVLGFFGGGGS